MNPQFEVLQSKADAWLNISLTENQLQQFEAYYELLVSWNAKMNLTAITDLPEVIQKHFLDSLAIARFMDVSAATRMLDVGTGAGFPGIPLKIVFPETEILLLDSLQKRLTFLDEVIASLGLEQITTIHGRSEDLGHQPDLRGQFDLVVSRAVANLSTLSEFCLPFAKTGGMFVAYKSEKTEEEIGAAKGAIHLLGGKLDRVEEYALPDSDLYRTLVFIGKKENTAKQYPRKAGTPLKKPLQ